MAEVFKMEVVTKLGSKVIAKEVKHLTLKEVLPLLAEFYPAGDVQDVVGALRLGKRATDTARSSDGTVFTLVMFTRSRKD